MRFVGTIKAKIDSKGRAFMPAAFRRVMQERLAASLAAEEDKVASVSETRLVLRKDVFEDCLVVYTEQEWYKRLDQLRSRLSVWNRKEQAVLRQFMTDVEWMALDNNGRFLIPRRYLQTAGIQSEITFVGMDNTIEVWAAHRLAEATCNSNLAQDIEGLMTGHGGGPAL